MQKNIFERHPKTTLWGIIALLAVLALFLLEFIADHFFGLGKPVIYQAHPIYGYRPMPNQVVARQPQHTIKINNLGLRAEQNWDLNDTHHKILFLGDSVTYGGSYINNPDLFSALAVKDLPGYCAGNAGVNGWGVDNVVAFIKDMPFLPADIYVAMFPEGDFYRGLTRIGGQLFWMRPPYFALEELVQYFVYKIHLMKLPYLHAYQASELEKTKVATLAVQHLKELAVYLKSQNKTFLIYITPTQQQVLARAPIDSIIQKLLAQYELPVIYLKDKLPPMTNAEKMALFHDVAHLSVQGHQVWGKIIAHDLQNDLKSKGIRSVDNANST